MSAPCSHRLFGGGGEARLLVGARVEALIELLDQMDVDPDLELEDCRGECPDDVGEVAGATWSTVA